MSNKNAWSWAIGPVAGLLGMQADSAHSQASAVKNAAQAQEQQQGNAIAAAKTANDNQIASLEAAKAGASAQASAAITAKARARAGSQSIFTSPLGLAEQASTSKKTLLGS